MMTPMETFICSVMEIFCFWALMNVFNRGYLKFKLKLIISVLASAAVITLTDGLALPVGYVINFGFMIIIMWLMLKDELVDVFFQFLMVISVLLPLEMLFHFMAEKAELFHSLSLLDRMVQLSAIVVICLLAGNNRWLHKRLSGYYSKYKKYFYIAEINVMVFVMVWLYVWDSEHTKLIQEMGVWLVFLLFWVGVNIFLIKKLVENSIQKKVLDILEQHMEMSESLMDSLNANIHEFNKHLHTFRAYCELEDKAEATVSMAEYIDALAKKNGEKTRPMSYSTGDGVINAFLFTKAKEAEEKRISLRYDAARTMPLFPCEKYELIEVIGNFVSNAFDYVEQLEEDQRCISLRIFSENGKSVIEVSNPYAEQGSINEKELVKKGHSTKIGNRGYGLANVKDILEKYQGALKLEIKNGLFISKALF